MKYPSNEARFERNGKLQCCHPSGTTCDMVNHKLLICTNPVHTSFQCMGNVSQHWDIINMLVSHITSSTKWSTQAMWPDVAWTVNHHVILYVVAYVMGRITSHWCVVTPSVYLLGAWVMLDSLCRDQYTGIPLIYTTKHAHYVDRFLRNCKPPYHHLGNHSCDLMNNRLWNYCCPFQVSFICRIIV